MTDAATGTLSASLEDYLEAILRIVQEKQVARAKDVGNLLHVGRSSVTGALHALADRELIHYAPYDLVTLTEKGRDLASAVTRRHEVLRDFFVKVLAVPPDEADIAACKMEHAISEKVLQRLVAFIAFTERSPGGGGIWVEGRGFVCADDAAPAGAGAGGAGATLDRLPTGARARIAKIGGTGGIRRRLLDMGATAGTVVQVERVAPLGDPIEVQIKGYHLTLRKEEAARIQVSPL
jgi:DtxR family Mn-dependent transcriptional regulator